MKYFLTSFFCVILLGITVFCICVVYTNSGSVFVSEDSEKYETVFLNDEYGNIKNSMKNVKIYTPYVFTAIGDIKTSFKDTVKDFLKNFNKPIDLA